MDTDGGRAERVKHKHGRMRELKEALKAANQWGQFGDRRGNEELSFAIAKVTITCLWI